MKINFKILVLLNFIFIFLFFLSGCSLEKTSNDDVFLEDVSFKEGNLSDWIVYADDMSVPRWEMYDGYLMEKSGMYAVENEYERFEGTNLLYKPSKDWSFVEIDSVFDVSYDDDGMGLLFNYVDEDNYYRYMTVADVSNYGPFRVLQVKKDGKFITLDRVNESYDVVEDDESTELESVKVIRDGSELSVFVDDKLVLNYNGSIYFDKGYVGFQTYAQDNAKFNSLVIKYLKP